VDSRKLSSLPASGPQIDNSTAQINRDLRKQGRMDSSIE
jgi:hypothetical protein